MQQQQTGSVADGRLRLLSQPTPTFTATRQIHAYASVRPPRPPNFPAPYQHVLQDHNYGAPPPRSPEPPPPPPPLPPLSMPSPGATSPLALAAAVPASAVTLPRPASPLPPPATPAAAAPSLPGDDDRPVTSAAAAAAASDDAEEADTAPGSEAVDDSVTRCICNFEHDDGYMICCDRCSVWQHVDCVGLDRAHIPDEYLCDLCQPRRLDRRRARSLQLKRRPKLLTDSEDSGGDATTPVLAVTQTPRRPAKLQQKVDRRRLARPKQATPTAGAVSTQRSRAAAAKQPRATVRPDRVRSSSGGGAPDTPTKEEPARKLRCWIDEYEQATTNQYSGELRARLTSMRTGAVPPPPPGPPRCTSAAVDAGAERRLVAALPVLANTTLLEFLGRCCLLAEFCQQQPLLSKRYQPHVLHYRFPRDALAVCIDARLYGNVARFVRRSCRPNAAIRHVVDKGALHLHVVATCPIGRDSEITIAHDQPGRRQLRCACGRGPNCAVLPTPAAAANGNVNNNSKPAAGGRRRRASVVRASTPSPSPPSEEGDSSEEGVVPPPPPPPSLNPTPSKKSPHRSPSKSESGAEAPVPPAPSEEPKKLTREERKIEAIMKAFERMEKQQQRQQAAAAAGDSPRKLSKHSREDSGSRNNSAEEQGTPEPRQRHKKGRKVVRSRLLSPRRQSAADSAGSEALSGDEAPPPLAPPQQPLPLPPLRCSPPLPPPLPPTVAAQSAPVSGLNAHGFRFPKTKKMLMTEWLNETVVNVVRHTPDSGESCDPIPSMYTRGARSPPVQRRASLSIQPAPSTPLAQPGCSAKKRWLRQAISEEGEPQMQQQMTNGSPCSGLPALETPGVTDYTTDCYTPLKKRRLARSSVSFEMTSPLASAPPLPPPPPPPAPFSTPGVDDPVPPASPGRNDFTATGVVDGSHTPEKDESVPVKPESSWSPVKLDVCPVRPGCDEEDKGVTHEASASPQPSAGIPPPSPIQKQDIGTPVKLEITAGGDDCMGMNVPFPNSVEKTVKHETAFVPFTDLKNTVSLHDDDKKDVLTMERVSPLKLAVKCSPESGLAGFLEAQMSPHVADWPPRRTSPPPTELALSRSAQTGQGARSPARAPVTAPQSSPEPPPSAKPAVVKRRLSLQDYRSRKKSAPAPPARIGEEPPTGEPLSPRPLDPPEPAPAAVEPVGQESTAANDVSPATGAPPTPERPPSPPSPPSPLHSPPSPPSPPSPAPYSPPPAALPTVRWNAAPTMLERQRENLTERLRREFGLKVDDQVRPPLLPRTEEAAAVWRPPQPVPPPASAVARPGPVAKPRSPFAVGSRHALPNGLPTCPPPPPRLGAAPGLFPPVRLHAAAAARLNGRLPFSVPPPPPPPPPPPLPISASAPPPPPHFTAARPPSPAH